MYCVKDNKKKSLFDKFKEINTLVQNIDLFNKYKKIPIKKNQLFSCNPPPFELVNKILYELIQKELNDNVYYEFSRNYLFNKKIIDKIEIFIPELKIYYLKCKHKKYLENFNEKKLITLFRQLIKPYDFTIKSIEKYNNGKKYLLYIIEKNKKLSFKKIDSFINFD